MKINKSLPIGVFDSGMGGLTVLRELIGHLPQESFLYLGDTARLPYGTKSQTTVLHYASRMAELLIERGIKLLVIACNTATTAALPHLQQRFSHLPIIGVVEPGARAAIQVTKNNHVALLATEATIKSAIYQSTLQTLNPQIQVTTQACGLFVALAEEGCIDDTIATAAVEKYLAPLISGPLRCDTIILGCTHFPVLLNPIKRFLGEQITVVDSAYSTATVVTQTLQQLTLNTSSSTPHYQYLVTDLPERFCRLGKIFLGHDISVEAVELVDGL